MGIVAAADENTAPRRRGRRPGGADTRTSLLDAARAVFAERGYDGATVRVIAERAGVDPAMVNHWFGGKEPLFVAALNLPADPATILGEAVSGDPDELAERILCRLLEVWDSTGGAQFAALLQSIATQDVAAALLREFIARVLVGKVLREVAPDRPELRATLCGTQMFGLAFVRYVLKVEPLASADHATIVSAVAPNLQRYLTGPLP
ncbi:TetR/AcrR family transcriptional regulator [Pseudonocardia sichuanensis]|uniref:TetR family transcriptional regulator n=1 Tax=Pseudonocardia kunmingensis TaxID=630975 RepID=A0A543DXM2_9PSEU|nr:TetR family transcriptional regulator [Pseudonocardia kunmingensis]TQM14009.1 TetR family transcriptional regulator [Pseudonocardia kunmingensis]